MLRERKYGAQRGALDLRPKRLENERMALITQADAIPAEVLADLEQVCLQSELGVVRDLELLRRVYERSAKTRAETLRAHGVQDIGVDIIRELRDDG